MPEVKTYLNSDLLDTMEFLRKHQRDLDTKWELDFLHDRLQAIKVYRSSAMFTEKQMQMVNELTQKLILNYRVERFNEIG